MGIGVPDDCDLAAGRDRQLLPTPVPVAATHLHLGVRLAGDA